MRRSFLWLLFFIMGAAGCGVSPAAPVVDPPTAVPRQTDAGQTLSTEPGPLWVLVSGVDEHGLMATPRLTLLAAPDPAAAGQGQVDTGQPAWVDAIRQNGPQGLRRFYHVQLVSGESGWLPDFYVRREAYLYLPDTNLIPLYDQPDGQIVAWLPNVSPVKLLDPTAPDWWQVETADGATSGWVPAEQVKESSEREFLQDAGHDHSTHEHDE